MILKRRELLRFGALAAGGAILSTSASSQILSLVPGPQGLDPLAPLPPKPLAPAAPQFPGVNPELLAKAKAAMDSHRVYPRDTIGIADFSLPSSEPRFHVVDLANGKVDSYRVAHGRGSDPDHSGFVEKFSNDFGSYASSNGTYLTGDYYDGKYGLSMKVRGLDWSNYNAEPRAIVIHNAWYAEDDMIPVHGKLGRSEGCFALPYDSLQEVLQRTGPGRFLYADKLA